jgi:hypothetical protein
MNGMEYLGVVLGKEDWSSLLSTAMCLVVP